MYPHSAPGGEVRGGIPADYGRSPAGAAADDYDCGKKHRQRGGSGADYSAGGHIAQAILNIWVQNAKKISDILL